MGTSHELPPDSVRHQVERVTASRTFENAPVLRRFLKHISEYTLAGKTDQLKEYALGVDVFERTTSFDPRIDALVRVQAGRLRSRLEEYYRTEAEDDDILIELPKGHYIPAFRRAPKPDRGASSECKPQRVPNELADLPGAARIREERGAVRRWPGFTAMVLTAVCTAVLVALVALSQRSGVRSTALEVQPAGAAGAHEPILGTVAVARFENRTSDASFASLGHSAAEQVIRAISELPVLEVDQHPVEATVGRVGGPPPPSRTSRSSLLVTGGCDLTDGRLEFQVLIHDRTSGRLLHRLQPIGGVPTRAVEWLELLEQKVAGAVAVHFDTFFGGLQAVSRPPTLKAYQEYRAGLEVFQSDYRRSLAHLDRALDEDPGFLLPLLVMFYVHANLAQHEQVEAVLQRMEYQLDRLGPAERLLVEFARAQSERRGPQALRLLQDLELWVPTSLFVNHNIVQQLVQLNRPRTAVEVFERLPVADRTLRHSIGIYRVDLVLQAYHMLGQYERELEQIRHAQSYAPGVLRLVQAEVRALAALGRLDDVTGAIDRALAMQPTAGPVGTIGAVIEHAALELHVHGYRDVSKKVAGRAIEWLNGRPESERRTVAHRVLLGRALYAARRWQEAGQVFSRLAAEDTGNVIHLAFMGQVAARLGDDRGARIITEKLARIDARHRRAYALLARARIAAILGDRKGAVSHLREAVAAGLPFGPAIHNTIDFESLLDYAPYVEMLRPVH